MPIMEEWHLFRYNENYSLRGKCYNFDKKKDGTPIDAGTIISIDFRNSIAVTVNGRFQLGRHSIFYGL